MGARGNINVKPISADDILAATDGGWDIFFRELGKFPVGKAFKHPLKRDKQPSGGIIQKGGIWFLCDFAGTFDTMTAIQFVRKRYSLSFVETIDKICQDMGINPVTREYKPTVIVDKPPVFEESEMHIGFSTCKFDKRHAKYWEDYHLSEDYLTKYNVFRVKDLSINRRRVRLLKNELTFAYWAEDIDKCKILRIGVDKALKWRNNVPNNYIWFENMYETCDRLIISKSVKDALVLSLFGICSVATQNESAKILGPNMGKLREISKNLVINFGSDKQGKEESNKITEEFKIKHYNTPDYALEKGANDVAEFAKLYGMEALEQHLKSKKLLK